MKNIRGIAFIFTGFIMLAGCQSTGSKETIGTLGGAALGGLAGSQIGNGNGQLVAVAVGTLGGALIGNSIGKSLDEVDRMKAGKTQHNALERGPSKKRHRWNNPDTGNSGSTTPMPAYEDEEGRICREFEQEVTIKGVTEKAYGKACRESDGRWKIVSS